MTKCTAGVNHCESRLRISDKRGAIEVCPEHRVCEYWELVVLREKNKGNEKNGEKT